MKKILLTLVFFITFTIVFANPVTLAKAEKFAKSFLNYKSKNSFRILNTKKIEDEKITLAYVFQLKPDGFIAVSSDDNVFPIMAYSFHNQLIFDDNNLILQMLKQDIKNRIKYNPIQIKKKNKKLWQRFDISKNRDYFQQWPAPNSTTTGGWVEDKWNQTGIYAQFCPLDNTGQRSVVGCVATAMSMIIDFHKYIGNVHFTDADDYWSGYNDYFRIDDTHAERDYPSFPELNQYLNILRTHYQNGQEITSQDKGALCFACGVSVQMDYSSQGSGSRVYKVATALINKFNFVSANYIDNYGSSFYNTLKNNMKAMKPAELGIYTSGYNDGHAIICDGYNTDDYYHLNFGWGSSDNTCWYQLPNGMPYNYSIVDGAAVDIEGGDIPVQVTGQINIENNNSEGTYITLEGPRFYEAYVLDNSCYFEIPAVETGTYTATAIKDGRIYYDSHVVEITNTNHYITFNMGNFEALTGTINAPINPIGTKIDIYKDGEIIYSGVCENSNGSFSIPNVLPGNYLATASLADNYFDLKNIVVTAENQTVNFNLESYNGNFNVGYHNFITGKWTLMANYTISCGIKLTESEILAHQNEPLAKVAFLAPASSDICQIKVQLWEDNTLLAENEVTDFQEGQWVTGVLDKFIILNPSKEYYVGYQITSQNSDMTYVDNGPRVEGKGAFFRTGSWTQIPSTVLDKNFCIEGIFISQDYATISGNISTVDEYQDLQNGIVVTQNYYISHSDNNGYYSLNLPAGTYNLTAFLPEHQSQTTESITVQNGDSVSDINFILEYQLSNSSNVIQSVDSQVKVYPNPYYKTSNKSSIAFSLSDFNKGDKLMIYNLRGEKIKELYINNDKIFWDLTNFKGKYVTSGIYFYRLKGEKSISKLHKFIIVK